MTEIKNRGDISVLVNTFYAKIRKDDLLGPIFNNSIPNEKWKEHLVKLTDFWETKLFGVDKFKGNPVQKHIKVDKSINYGIEQKHFAQWLQLWFETIDELYVGELAERAKNAAGKMAEVQFFAIAANRPNKEV